MKRLSLLALAAVATVALVHADFADAARMGGGRSFGMQRSITPPAARTTPPAAQAPQAGQNFNGPAANPVLPAKPGATAAAPAAAAGAAKAAPSGMSRWLGPIAGLAAGLGLAALFSHLGLSAELGSLLLIGLLVVGAIILFRAFAARSARNAGPQYAAAGAGSRAPFETAREPAFGADWGTNDATPASAGRFPPGFDPAPFVEQAKQQFHRLQSAYDRGDRALLADVTTPAMHEEIVRELETRGGHQPTEVAMLDAEVLEVVREGDQYVATVRFHGALREDGARDPHPFEELWHLVKPVNGSSGWLLAGIQQVGTPALA